MDVDNSEIYECDAAVGLAFTILGKRWNGQIIDKLGSGSLCFAAVRRAVPGISDAVLSDRLSELGDVALISRTVDPGPPVAVMYALTERGERLVPILAQLGQWASSNLEP